MEPENIKIIIASPEDWQLYKQIRLESLRMEPQAFKSKYSEKADKPDQYWIDKLSDANETVLLASIDGEIVGTMKASYRKNGVTDEVIIHGGYVNSVHRRKGVGKKLLSELINKSAKRGGIKKAKLQVKGSQIKARKFYESEGFSVTSKDAENMLTMEKSLD